MSHIGIVRNLGTLNGASKTMASLLGSANYNGAYFFGFYNNPSDNPFSFSAGYVIALRFGDISGAYRLIGLNDNATLLETKKLSV